MKKIILDTSITSSLAQIFKLCSLSILMILAASCEDFLEISPPSKQLPSSEIFESETTANSAMVGLYVKLMENFNSAFNGQLTLWAAMSADELNNTVNNPQYEEFASNAINPSNDQLKQYFWTPVYNYIYQTNAILEGVAASDKISSALAMQLEGEARVMRALSHFYLVNLFGDVPYVTTTDYRQNSVAVRTSTADVYAGIVGDLLRAQSILTDTYVTSGRVRPNRIVATALLARVYLYLQDWPKAEEEASKILSNSAFVLQTDLTKVFLAGSPEAIWQMVPVFSNMNTAEGNRFAYTSGIPPNGDLTASLLSTFTSGDKRLANWVNQYTASGKLYAVPFKYKVRTATTITENYTVLRLSEQYLIRAEARTKQGKLSQAISDLDVIRQRAGLGLILATNPGISQADLLLAIERERRVELFCEWGHRWIDLKRTGRVNTVMQAYKPSKWKPESALYPLPLAEILVNGKLVQNPGY